MGEPNAGRAGPVERSWPVSDGSVTWLGTLISWDLFTHDGFTSSTTADEHCVDWGLDHISFEAADAENTFEDDDCIRDVPAVS